MHSFAVLIPSNKMLYYKVSSCVMIASTLLGAHFIWDRLRWLKALVAGIPEHRDREKDQ
jgi:hypothetical protein